MEIIKYTLQKIYNLKNIEINIINIIIDYKKNIEEYELTFFNNLPDLIDKRYLNIYYNKDFSNIYDNQIDIKQKIKIFQEMNLEIYDIELSTAIIIKKKNNNYYYKWLIFKSNIYENYINDGIVISFFKNILKISNKKIYYFNDILNISNDYRICLHCIIKEYILYSNEYNNIFLNEIKEKIL